MSEPIAHIVCIRKEIISRSKHTHSRRLPYRGRSCASACNSWLAIGITMRTLPALRKIIIALLSYIVAVMSLLSRIADKICQFCPILWLRNTKFFFRHQENVNDNFVSIYDTVLIIRILFLHCSKIFWLLFSIINERRYFQENIL